MSEINYRFKLWRTTRSKGGIKIKRKFTYLLVFITISILVIVNLNTPRENKVNLNNTEIQNVESDENSGSVASLSSSVSFDNGIEDFVKYSHNIILGSVSSVSMFSEGVSEFVIEIETEFKGNAEVKKIFVYESSDLLQVGNQYLLFLDKFEGGLYPSANYTSIEKNSIMKVQGDFLIHHSPFLPSEMTLQKTIDEIKQSPNLNFLNVKNYDQVHVKDTAKLEELTEDADIIAQIIPSHFVHENKYTTLAEVKVVEQYKGKLTSDTKLFLPSSVKLNQEYIVYLQEKGNITIVASKNGSLINKSNTEKWDEAKKLINSMNN